jgi:hypothetical protein
MGELATLGHAVGGSRKECTRVEVKISTLFSQKARKEGWGTRFYFFNFPLVLF